MQIKRMQWFKKPSAWEYAQAQRQNRARMASDFLDQGAAVSNALLNTQINLSSGMATIAAQRSLARSQSELAATKARLNKLA